jgi:L-aspartate oxidase
VVFARRVIRRTVEAPGGNAPTTADAHDLSEPVAGEAAQPTREAVQSLMWEDVGIVRDAEGLGRAKAALGAWDAALAGDRGEDDPRVTPTDRAALELRDLVLCSRLVVEAALLREESRGAHYRRDFPESREDWRRHVVFRLGARG